MSLADYTIQELEAEIKRRKIAERHARGDLHDYEVKYLYAVAIVVDVDTNGWQAHDFKYRVAFDDESKAKYGPMINENCIYQTVTGKFNKKTAPRVGDVVRLRKRITALHPNWAHKWIKEIKISEIVRRANEEN